MTTIASGKADFAEVRNDLAALKRDVGRLIAHLEGDARNKFRNGADQISQSARDLSHSATAQGRRSANAIGVWSAERPVMVFLIALGVGYLGVRSIMQYPHRRGTSPGAPFSCAGRDRNLTEHAAT